MDEMDDFRVLQATSTEVKNRYLTPGEILYAIDTGTYYVGGKHGKPQALVSSSTSSDGGVGWQKQDFAGIEIASAAHNPLPKSLNRSAAGKTVWLWKHSAGAQPLQNSWWIYVPTGDGYYSGFAYGSFLISGAINHLGRQFCGLIGTWRNHLSSGVVKTGAGWGTSSLNYAADNTATRSANAGDTYADTVTGHTIVLRGLYMADAGFGVVSIDGNWTAANRLPAFTSADYDAGLCRLSDIGKRYIEQGSTAVCSDVHTVLADGLTDAAHTVVIEVTGTKRAVSSSTRVYISGLVGCSAADVDQPLGATRVIAKYRDVQDLRTSSGSALIWTPKIEKATPGTFEFLGEVHGAETLETEIIELDGVSQSALAAGSYASGTALVIERVSTLASTDATTTPVVRKRSRMIFSARHVCSLIVAQTQQWIVDKTVQDEFPLMLAVGQRAITTGTEQPNFNTCDLGGIWQSQPSDFTGNASAQRGNVPALYAVVGSTEHDVKAYAVILDGGETVRYWANSTPDLVYLHDRSEDKLDKVYFCAATAPMKVRHYAGEVVRSVVGLGTIKESARF